VSSRASAPTDQMRAIGTKGTLLVLLLASCGILYPAQATADGYETYVACSAEQDAAPAASCTIGGHPGAFFRSPTSTAYTVCVSFPDGQHLCSSDQYAEAGTLYVNAITTTVPGVHEITWSVGGATVGTWQLTMEPRAGKPLPKALVEDGSDRFEARPVLISYTGDGTGFLGGQTSDPAVDHFGQLEWRTWGRHRAFATGVQWVNNCRPGCALGSFHPHAATVILRRVRHNRFTRMWVKAKRGSRSVIEIRKLLRLSGGFYIWG
jgi:hypothetical protein